jgi:hypothetical protein
VSETEAALRSFEDEQDAAIYLTAALSGLRRGELLALRWADIDFEQSSIRVYEGYSANTTGKTKSRKSRTVPMIDKVAERLTQIKQRPYLTAGTHLVFVSRERTNVDGSALRRRYVATLDAADLRRLRFHDLRHTFGSLAINVAPIVQVQAWMGHADIKTTMRYLHHKSPADDARLLSAAFDPAQSRTRRRLQRSLSRRRCDDARSAATRPAGNRPCSAADRHSRPDRTGGAAERRGRPQARRRQRMESAPPQVLVVPRADVELGVVVRHLAELGIVEAH